MNMGRAQSTKLVHAVSSVSGFVRSHKVLRGCFSVVKEDGQDILFTEHPRYQSPKLERKMMRKNRREKREHTYTSSEHMLRLVSMN